MPGPHNEHTDDTVGRRITSIRKRRGWTQRALAQRAFVSYSTLTKIESGHMAASPAVTAACARALRVPVTDLTGQPYMEELRQDQLEELVQPLRHAIANPFLPTRDDVPPRPLEAIRTDIRTLEESRLRGEYMGIGASVPALIEELINAVHAASTAEVEGLHSALAMAYRLANSFAHKLGFLDLALLALDRMETAAARSDDPYLPVAICHYRGDYFLHHGAYEIGLRAIEQVRRGDMRALSAMGTMHLKAAVLHSRQRTETCTQDALTHIEEARELAGHTAGQPDPHGLVFDRADVEIHATSVRIDVGDVGGAVEHGAALRFPPGWALNRAGHHHMDMARGYERIGRREEALAALLRARNAAPCQTRYHPTTRETITALLRATRSRSRELTRYARWVGV